MAASWFSCKFTCLPISLIVQNLFFRFAGGRSPSSHPPLMAALGWVLCVSCLSSMSILILVLCTSDPLPGKLLNDNVNMLTPFLVALFNPNRSLVVVWCCVIHLQVTHDVKSYILFLLNCLVAWQLVDKSAPIRQNAWVLADILCAVDSGDLALTLRCSCCSTCPLPLI